MGDLHPHSPLGGVCKGQLLEVLEDGAASQVGGPSADAHRLVGVVDLCAPLAPVGGVGGAAKQGLGEVELVVGVKEDDGGVGVVAGGN